MDEESRIDRGRSTYALASPARSAQGLEHVVSCRFGEIGEIGYGPKGLLSAFT